MHGVLGLGLGLGLSLGLGLGLGCTACGALGMVLQCMEVLGKRCSPWVWYCSALCPGYGTAVLGAQGGRDATLVCCLSPPTHRLSAPHPSHPTHTTTTIPPHPALPLRSIFWKNLCPPKVTHLLGALVVAGGGWFWLGSGCGQLPT